MYKRNPNFEPFVKTENKSFSSVMSFRDCKLTQKW